MNIIEISRTANPIIVLAFVLTMNTGCAHNQKVTQAQAEQQIESLSLTKTATIHYVNGQRFKGKNIDFAPDTTTWTNPHGDFKQEATAMISHIDFTSAGKGAVEGLGIAAGIGLAAGLLAAGATTGGGLLSPGEVGLAMGVIAGGLGVLIGVPAGATVGSKKRFRVDGLDSERSRQ